MSTRCVWCLGGSVRRWGGVGAGSGQGRRRCGVDAVPYLIIIRVRFLGWEIHEDVDELAAILFVLIHRLVQRAEPGFQRAAGGQRGALIARRRRGIVVLGALGSTWWILLYYGQDYWLALLQCNRRLC